MSVRKRQYRLGGHKCVFTSVTRRGPAPAIENHDQAPLTGVSRKKRPLRRIAAIALGVVVVAVVILGVVRVPTSAVVGTQTTICGTTIGLSLFDEQRVSFGSVSDEPLAPGDKVRVNLLCTVEVIEIERTNHDPGAVGGVARVDLKWGPW